MSAWISREHGSWRSPFVSSSPWTTCFAVVAIASAIACGQAPPAALPPPTNEIHAVNKPSIEDRAKTFIAELAAGQWTHPKTAFDAAMADAAKSAQLEAVWQSLVASAGAFRAIEKATLQSEAQGHRIVLVTSTFERGEKTLRLVFDKEDKLAGIFLHAPPPAWNAPPYASVASFEERELEIGTTPALPGTLTIPKRPGPHPAIVLVHGSGPNDRDESVGGAKPFKDLAWGLANKGVAVLRYVKRSRVSPAGITTQKDEVEIAARDALNLLRITPGIDPKRVFLLGHSQGGYLAPRIAKANPEVAGVVILAGSTQPLEDSLVEQLTYFTTLHPGDAALRAKVDVARAFKQRVEAPALRPDEDVALPFGGTVKGAYFLDIRGYSPPAVAKTLDCPILVLQGERDYQVTMKEFDAWKSALSSRPLVTMKTYATLNHLFISGSGAPNPEEYAAEGHVDPAVVVDIAAWIAAAKR